MRRAIVHIGTPRTGTTSLQAFLTTHRDQFKRAGLLYPDLTPGSASRPHLSHQYLGETFDGRRPRAERVELLTALAAALAEAEPDTLLLSYEGLCLLPAWRSVPKVLADLFARHGFQMEILLTVKAQALYAQSQYTWRCQFLRERHLFGEALPADLRHRRYDYGGILRQWARAAAQHVHVVPVHDRRSDAPLIERILVQLGLHDLVSGMTPADFARRDNPSLGPVAIEVARRLRSRGIVVADRWRARAITDFIADEARTRGLDAVAFHALDDATLAQIEQKFGAANDAFAQRVWGGNWSRRVAPTPSAPINELGPGPTDPIVARHLEEIEMVTRERFGIGDRATLGSWLRGLLADRAPR